LKFPISLQRQQILYKFTTLSYKTLKSDYSFYNFKEIGFQIHIVAYYFINYLPISFQISLSSTEVGIVPDNTITDISNLTILTTGGVDILSDCSFQMSVHLSPMDRATRVLRYKEKRHARKFEKTIRYATRKAYAEARPRIKGRFAKRSDAELQVGHMSSPPELPNSSYGTVPWF
jgi:hypothetical protein